MAEKKPHTFTTYTEVEVDIPARDLEREGWRWVGSGEPAPEPETVMDVIERWHDSAHITGGAFRFCYESPCAELRNLPVAE